MLQVCLTRATSGTWYRSLKKKLLQSTSTRADPFPSLYKRPLYTDIHRINPALRDINQSQSYTNNMLSFISSGCATELSQIRGEVEILSQRQLEFHDLVAEKAETLSSGLECIRDGVAGT